MDKISFADELRELRGEAAQKQISDELDVPFKTYQSWEEGRRTPGALAKKQIRQVLLAREHTSKKNPLTKSFMRFCIGYMESRPEKKPVWDSRHKNILRWENSDKIVSVFHLLSHGETLLEAESMAGISGLKWEPVDK